MTMNGAVACPAACRSVAAVLVTCLVQQAGQYQQGCLGGHQGHQDGCGHQHGHHPLHDRKCHQATSCNPYLCLRTTSTRQSPSTVRRLGRRSRETLVELLKVDVLFVRLPTEVAFCSEEGEWKALLAELNLFRVTSGSADGSDMVRMWLSLWSCLPMGGAPVGVPFMTEVPCSSWKSPSGRMTEKEEYLLDLLRGGGEWRGDDIEWSTSDAP
ncbi:hypothetical protein C0Q70_02388 [Pomacea canaliculata]|uniref:Uncharacterized protein n=1 Tax=Pomacea canaliculata TaxID=400727 RepID=A0A2T7PPS1_POMCA|nr:hypothetical protein C0Q70_02388 [Pomacea canaliculata]